MELLEYLDKLTGQIRCVKARPMVEEEFRQHIEDQAQAYRREGMDGPEALEAAVKEMGDPVDTGMQLDRIHRPKMEWSVLLLVAVLSAVGLVIQYLFIYQCNSSGGGYLLQQAGCVACGFVLMILVYRIDYTILARLAVPLWIILFVLAYVIWNQGTGPLSWAQRRIALYAITLLYMPVFAGVLYRFRSGGYLKIVYSLAFLLVPFHIARMAVSGAAQIQVLLIGVIMVSAAVYRDWFRVKKKLALAVVWGLLVFLPPILLVVAAYTNNIFRLLADYQADRIKIFLHPGQDLNGWGYQIFHIRKLLNNSRLIGGAAFPEGYSLPGMQNDYVVTGIFAYYGVLAGTLLVLLILLFLGKVLRIAWKQKNQLGSMMALGCALVFTMQGLLYIYSNLFGSLVGQMNLPFVSHGLICTVTNFILMGIYLSIYRGSMITDERSAGKWSRYRIKIWKEGS